MVGLRNELLSHKAVMWRVTGGEDNPNIGELLTHDLRKFDAIHGSGHSDVTENDGEIGAGIQHIHRFVCATALHDFETGFAQFVSDHRADEVFVFNHHHDCGSGNVITNRPGGILHQYLLSVRAQPPYALGTIDVPISGETRTLTFSHR
jgi:hypothetical protein